MRRSTILITIALLPFTPSSHATDGSISSGHCTNAQMASTASGYDTVKGVINTVGSTATAILAATGYGESACPGISLAVSASGTGLDIAAGQNIGQMVGQFASGVGTMASQLGKKAGEQAAKETTEKAAEEGGKKAGENTLGCVIASATMGATAYQSWEGVKAQDAGQGSANDACQSMQNLNTLNDGTVPTYTPPEIPKFETPDGPGNNKTANTGNKGNKPCADSTGDAYLKCLSEKMPELSALISSQDFMGAVNQMFPGKHFGDVIKGFNGKSLDEAANYLAQMSGNPAVADIAKAAVNTGAQIAASMGGLKTSGSIAKVAPKPEEVTPGSYSGAARAVASTDADMDFNKMMADMMKQLNPEAEGTKGEDPSELVFRQLDLLPPEKIIENRDISLFVRVGFRYRKKINELDRLNWSSEKNQANNSYQQ